MSVGAFFKKTLPSMALTVASGVPGPIGMVAGLVSSVVGTKLDPKADAINTAVEVATSDQLLQLKQLDAQHAETMQKLGFDDLEELAKIGTTDTADARLMQRTDKSWIPAMLVIVTTLGFFGTLAAVLRWGIPAQGHDLVIILISTEATVWLTEITFYFGSSKGSADKNAPLMNLANAAANGGK